MRNCKLNMNFLHHHLILFLKIIVVFFKLIECLEVMAISMQEMKKELKYVEIAKLIHHILNKFIMIRRMISCKNPIILFDLFFLIGNGLKKWIKKMKN